MYVVARTARKRPTLMHVLHPDKPSRTLCNVDLSGWSRAYLDEVIPQILCNRCTWIIMKENAVRGVYPAPSNTIASSTPSRPTHLRSIQ